MRVSSIAEMRELDRNAMEKFGIKDEILMENAGLASHSVLRSHLEIKGLRALVFCGAGNNGGDGFVVARKIHSDGGSVKVFILADKNSYRGAARANLEILFRLHMDIERLKDHEAVSEEISGCDLIVDGIFGTGLTRPVAGLYRQIIELINRSGKKILSLDIPSGVNGDTGQVMGVAVRASWTCTFGLPKLGNMLFPGFQLCGELSVSHISFPPEISSHVKVEISRPVPPAPRDMNGHKGSFGKALVIAGAPGYFGAPYFAALSFLKAGGGYSRLAAPEGMIPFIAAQGKEIVFVPQKETPSGSISSVNMESILDFSSQIDIIVMGPGMSLDDETQLLIRRLASRTDKPLLLDGDGITAICGNPQILAGRKAGTILTPHIGEMARLTGEKPEKIESNRVEILRRTSRELNSIIVLKGAHSLIGHPDGRVFINMSGNPGMASAGSGDVLAGAIAAMYGIGIPLDEAVVSGVFIHGLAGDLAAERKGEDGITASDIMGFLPLAAKLHRQRPVEFTDRYEAVKTV